MIYAPKCAACDKTIFALEDTGIFVRIQESLLIRCKALIIIIISCLRFNSLFKGTGQGLPP